MKRGICIIYYLEISVLAWYAIITKNLLSGKSLRMSFMFRNYSYVIEIQNYLL